MRDSGDLRREIEVLRQRISTLNAAILRISATLDFDTVLAEVVESARGLTGARYGVMITVDETGARRDSVFSGVPPEEQLAWPGNSRLWQHQRELPGPLRLANFSAYVRSLGIAPAPAFSRTFQGTPMRHCGADVGSFFLVEKADGEPFTDDEEELLVLFASQAAAAIANARTHRGEQQARADLAALVETSPVGVNFRFSPPPWGTGLNGKCLREAPTRRGLSQRKLGQLAGTFGEPRLAARARAVAVVETDGLPTPGGTGPAPVRGSTFTVGAPARYHHGEAPSRGHRGLTRGVTGEHMSLRQGEWAVAALFAAYALLYWSHVIGLDLPVAAQFSYFAGSGSMLCMALGMLLSARPRAVETSFGGLDRMYRLHKHLGVAALILFLAHFVTVPGEAEAVTAAEEEGLPIDLFGGIAMIGSTLLIVITLNRKVPYHRWLTTHRFMGLFFAVAGVHVVLALYDGEAILLLSPPGMVLVLMLLAGLAAFVGRRLFRTRKGKHAFTVVAVNRLVRATEVVLKPKDGMFRFEPGQFAFVTIHAPGFREAHPFTISSGAQENGLRFTMKVLGDYTRRVRDDLFAGADADVEGPYGRFNPLGGSDKQVWVAGGIGITPFLSVLRTMAPGHGRTIRLYYCVRVAAEALFFDELEERAAAVGGVTIARFDSAAGARIDASAIRHDLDGELAGWSYYLCGPKPLVNAVSEGLKTQGVPARRIHNEEFELR